MSLYIAVPEDEHGCWFDEPVGADSEVDAHAVAQTRWAGKLPPEIAIMVYRCSQVGQVVLPHERVARAERKE